MSPAPAERSAARTALVAVIAGLALACATLGVAALRGDDRCVVVSSPAGFPCAPADVEGAGHARRP